MKKQLISHKVTDEKTEFKKFFYSVIDAVQGETDARVGERSSEAIAALAALIPEAEDDFLELIILWLLSSW